jgi:hypothetical protein
MEMSINGVVRMFHIPTTSLKGHIFGLATNKKKRLVIIMAQAKEKEVMDWVLEVQDTKQYVTLSQSCS